MELQNNSMKLKQFNGVAKQFNEVAKQFNDAKMNSTESQKLNEARCKIQ